MVGVLKLLTLIIVLTFIGFIFDKVFYKLLERVFKGFRYDKFGAFILLFPLLGVYTVVPYSELGEKPIALIEKTIIFLSILYISFIFARFISLIAEVYMLKVDRHLSVSLINIVTYGIILSVGFLVAIQTVGISITPILTAFGVGGIAVALAVKDTLSNIFAGMHILMTRQIRAGDYIQLETGESGYVMDINWRNTSIRTLPNNTIIIPNSKLASLIVTNYHIPEKEMSVVVPLSVGYEFDLEKVESTVVEVAREVQRSVKGAKRNFEPFIRYREFKGDGIHFSVILRVEEFVDQYLVQHEFLKRLKRRFDEEGIKIIYTQRDVEFRNSLLVSVVRKKDGA